MIEMQDYELFMEPGRTRVLNLLNYNWGMFGDATPVDEIVDNDFYRLWWGLMDCWEILIDISREEE